MTPKVDSVPLCQFALKLVDLFSKYYVNNLVIDEGMDGQMNASTSIKCMPSACLTWSRHKMYA